MDISHKSQRSHRKNNFGLAFSEIDREFHADSESELKILRSRVKMHEKWGGVTPPKNQKIQMFIEILF